jgi:TrmH family RNA methyltransferase
MYIASVNNLRVKNAVRLKLKRHRDQQQKMLIEGYYPLFSALRNKYPIDELYFCPSFFSEDGVEAMLVQDVARTGIPIIEVEEQAFTKMAYRKNPEGLLALAPQIHAFLDAQQPASDGLYIVLEAVEKPGNLGAILRSADCTGATGVIVCEARADIFNPNVIRASMGTFFGVPVLESSTSGAIAWCREHDVQMLAAVPDGGVVYIDVDMNRPTAIVMGTEQTGLGQQWIDNADILVRIPMFGQANSLNVATAATLLLYEAVRRRISEAR